MLKQRSTLVDMTTPSHVPWPRTSVLAINGQDHFHVSFLLTADIALLAYNHT